MGKISSKENKNVYQKKREELGLSREAASELLDTLTPERIERIESEKITPNPSDVLDMSRGYKAPHLCNYYCANECPIGQEYIPEVKVKDLSQIVLEMLASLNSMAKKKERLIEITADGVVDSEELDDFIYIQEELEHISITVETLQLWVEKMLADGKIDVEEFNRRKGELK